MTPAINSGRFTPEPVRGTIDIATVSTITGFTITSTKPETGKTAVEYTKSHAEPVAGLGQAAYWFPTAGQLSVELGGEAVCTIYVIGLRIHRNDPKGGAIQIVQKAVPGTPHS